MYLSTVWYAQNGQTFPDMIFLSCQVSVGRSMERNKHSSRCTEDRKHQEGEYDGINITI